MSLLEDSVHGILTVRGWLTTIFCNIVLIGLLGCYVLYEVEIEGKDIVMPFPQSAPRKH